ncbi:outer membrane protein transport protein [Acetobacteraceae bacterium KSS8]|uniref:Outer membrane protein transport protein n=1 Tax=Endosaccharibacter trunci TaxID=2812733 RepID=A0ABT1W8R3_9PROT|nr:outer membrane protein transport protein [Acetobacteraceae bacterium KSS8]
MAHANAGFALNDGMADWTANAYAGEAAKAYDAGTAWTNPAGMVRIQGNEFDGTVNLIDPSLAFRGQDYVNGVAVPGRQSSKGIDAAVSGGTATVISLSPRLKLGLAIQSPFASRLAFEPADYTGRYQATRNIPTNIQALFSVAYAIDRHLSIGGGPIVSYFKERQAHALNLQNAQTALGTVSLGPQGVDPVAQFRGDDWSVGYDVGALYQFNDNVRVGVNYHSATYYKLQGYQDVYVPEAVATLNPLNALIPGIGSIVSNSLKAQTYNSSVKVALPGWLDTSVYWQISPEWAVMGNVTWTNWSLFQHNKIVPDDPSILSSTDIQYNFRDTVTAGVGVNYRPRWQPRLMLQGGVTYDQSPVTNSNRQATIPDGDRVEIGVGASYRATRNITLSLAYTHYFFPGSNTIDNAIGNVSSATPLGNVTLNQGTIRGHYNLANDALAIGFKQVF